jgi:FMN-dependent NADH-azoreductase
MDFIDFISLPVKFSEAYLDLDPAPYPLRETVLWFSCRKTLPKAFALVDSSSPQEITMPKLLVIEASPRGASSVSRNLMQTFVSNWKTAHPGGKVLVRDLVETSMPHISMPWLAAYFTPPEAQTPEMKDALKLSDELVAELLSVDEIAISTPVYNYNIPSNLKSWVDHIVRKGITLGFDGAGLVTGVKASLIVASGGTYGEGSPIADRNIAPQYMKLLLGVIGITDVTVIHGEAAKNVDMGEISMADFIAAHTKSLIKAATV